MEFTELQPAGLKVSALGCGCTTFGREIDESAAHAFLDHAQANGLTLLDTASAYGGGKSEEILRTWLKSRRPADGSLVIATKILPPYDPESITQSVESCLQRLGLEAIDLLYLHRWDATADAPESLAALDGLVRAGKVRALGVSNYEQPQLEAALAIQQENQFAQFCAVQNNFNFAVSDFSPAYLEFCADRKIATVGYSPLGAGFLTGKHQQLLVEAGSRFDIVPEHQDVYFHEEGWRKLARLEEVAKRHQLSQAHLALAWAMHQNGIASVLVGGRTTAHLDQAFAALAFDEPEIFAELDAA
ncbi:MAG: aryl-alcohol dehydrogenase-like predicted oxidoreductase [Verrucomicrobiales bacterium]|jgi:aryl-alcohol dehydrogenase-like predicted oxidoreductase